jgi:hypothetical protein
MPKLGPGLGLAETIVSSLIPTSGLSLWLKADAGVTLGGSYVAAWADQSGNGNNTDDAGNEDYRPLFVNNVVNGKPAIRFNTFPRVLKTSAPSTIGNSGNLTIIAVYNYNNINNDWATVVSKGDLNTNAESQTDLSAQFINGDFGRTNSFGVMSPAPAPAWTYSYTNASYANQWIIHEGISDITNNSQKMFINGSLVSSSISAGSINALNIKIGIGNAGSTRPPLNPNFGGFQGDIAEVIIYDKALTTPERQQVEAYLNAKYAIY